MSPFKYYPQRYVNMQISIATNTRKVKKQITIKAYLIKFLNHSNDREKCCKFIGKRTCYLQRKNKSDKHLKYSICHL
jgi:ribosomal protein L35AE/L33A